jgi:hypothetical protein
MDLISKNDWELEPFIRVGIFKLGEPLSLNFIREYLKMWPTESNTQDEFPYDIIGTNSFLSTDCNDVIQHVSCRDQCNHKGTNLIGKSLEEVEVLLGYKTVVKYPLIDPDTYNIDELGLLIWVEEGLVVTVDCGIYIDPDEI